MTSIGLEVKDLSNVCSVEWGTLVIRSNAKDLYIVFSVEGGTLVIGSNATIGKVLSCDSRCCMYDEITGRFTRICLVPDPAEGGFKEEINDKWEITRDFVAVFSGPVFFARKILKEVEYILSCRRNCELVVDYDYLDFVLKTKYNTMLESKNAYLVSRVKTIRFILVAVDQGELTMKIYGYLESAKGLYRFDVEEFQCAGSGGGLATPIIGSRWNPTRSAEDMVDIHQLAMLSVNAQMIDVGGIHRSITVRLDDDGRLVTRSFDMQIGQFYRVA